MSNFNWRKNIENSIKDRLLITIGAARIFFGQKVTNLKPPKTSLDAMDLLKLTGGICGGIWWKIMRSTKNESMSEYNNQNFITFIGS